MMHDTDAHLQSLTKFVVQSCLKAAYAFAPVQDMYCLHIGSGESSTRTRAMPFCILPGILASTGIMIG